MGWMRDLGLTLAGAIGGVAILSLLPKAGGIIPSDKTWLVVRGNDNMIYYKEKSQTDWKQIPVGSTLFTPAAVMKDGYLDIFVIGQDNALYTTRLNPETGDYSPWVQTSGSTPVAPAIA
jgi:hypothetical protein